MNVTNNYEEPCNSTYTTDISLSSMLSFLWKWRFW